MEPRYRASIRKASLAATALLLTAGVSSEAAISTWTGGGGDDLWSTAANWGGTAPSATGDQLTFAGSTQTTNTNDLVTSVVNGSNELDGAFTFDFGSGDFTLNGTAIDWETNSNGQFIANNGGGTQTFNMGFSDINPGSSDRSISAGGPGGTGVVIFNGDINFGNDRLFTNGFAGTVVLNGNNSGDGTGNAIAGGTNSFRSTMRNQAANTQLILGSTTALGNAGTGTIEGGDAVLKGLVANWEMEISASVPDLDLSGTTLVVNTGGAIDYHGEYDVTFGYLGNQNGNRDFNVSGDGSVTIANGIFFSEGTGARQFVINVGGGFAGGGAGEMVVDGKLYNTVHSDGILSQKTSAADSSVLVNATARFQGGKITLNGDSSETFAGGEVRANGAGTTIVIGHDNAMGDATSYVDIDNGSTLDLNGHTIAQTFLGIDGDGVGGIGAIINSDSANAAGVASDIHNRGSVSVGGAGDVELQNVYVDSAVNRNITKYGSGTLTLSGDITNNRYGLIVNDGTVLLNKGGIAEAVINNPLVVNGGTVRLTGASLNQIHDADPIQINGGTLDLNGRSETVSDSSTVAGNGVGGVGALINDTAATSATLSTDGTGALTLSGNASAGGTGDLELAVVIGDGGNAFGLAKVGAGKLSLTGSNTYTGNTAVNEGELNVSGAGTVFGDVSVAAGASLSGDGVIVGGVVGSGLVSPGNNAGTLTVGGDVTLDATASLAIEIGGLTAGTFDLLDVFGTANLGGSLDLSVIGGYTPNLGDTFEILSASSRVGTFAGVTGLDIGGGLAFDVLYGINNVMLEVISGGILLGDLDGDGFVGITDLNAILSNWNATVTPGDLLAGDPSNDGFVGIEDLNVVLGNWNAGTPPSTVTVPEPASLAMLSLGSLTMLRRRR